MSTPAQPSMPQWLTEPDASARKAHRGNDGRRWPVVDAVVAVWWLVVILAACWCGLPVGRVEDLDDGTGG
ncbi:hypothetical protein ACQP2U_42745 (plasmid) [Nocardia sp. CA-084685]|uniref:hypothetical protein n=1 Tax=Nocardia sp. CA-084685 TaxID=3239970 RepID=UPI003D9594DE